METIKYGNVLKTVSEIYMSNSLPNIRDLSYKLIKKFGLKDVLRKPYYFFQDIFSDNSLLKRNAELKNVYEGKRIFLCLTGRSILDVNIELLNNEYTFGASFLGCPDLDPRYSSKYGAFIEGVRHWNIPGRYCQVLEKEIDKEMLVETSKNRSKWPKVRNLSFFAPRTTHGSPLDGSVYTNKNLAKLGLDFWRATIESFPNTTFFLFADERKWYEQNNLFKNSKVYYIHSQPLLADSQVEIDLTRRIHGQGAIINMITAAIFMGFKEIYLCGAGYTYQPQQFFTYYYQPSFPIDFPKEKRTKVIDEIMKIEPVRILKIEQDELSYRPIWVHDSPVSDQHRIINGFARDAGVNIFNITPEGFQSPIYEKVTWDYVKQHILK